MFRLFMYLMITSISLFARMDYVSKEIFLSCADLRVDEYSHFDARMVKEGSVVYVLPELLSYFFSYHHPKITARYILVTHHYDYSTPGKFAYVLDDDKLIAWFAQNVDDFFHPKLHPIPIGIDSRNAKASKMYLFKFRNQDIKKKHLLYMNFSTKTNFAERGPVYTFFSAKPFCFSPKQRQYEIYLKDLASSFFVLSPRGAGLDCYRTWEALYMGAIPVVKSSSLNPLYEGLPVIIIDQWEEVTEEFLEKKYQEIQSQTFNLEKLTQNYWYKLIRSYK